MNIFFLDIDPKKCAEYHCDKHVVKMLLEIVQLLFTAHHLLGTPKELLAYKPIKNINHPMCIWIRMNIHNYMYSVDLALCLAHEYTYRYSKIHSCEKHVRWLLENIPPNIFKEYSTNLEYLKTTKISENSILNLTKIPLCMPDECKLGNTIKSYRKYYLVHKKYFAKWTSRNIPYWFHYSDISNYFSDNNIIN